MIAHLKALTLNESRFVMADPNIYTEEELAQEEWRDIPGLENYYQVSNLGRFRSLDREVSYNGKFNKVHLGKILSPGVTNTGYLQIRASRNGKAIIINCGRMVKKVFDRDDAAQVDHINRIKHDNRKQNLRYVTNVQNCSNRATSKMKNKKSKYKGVCTFRGRDGSLRWRSSFQVNGKRRHLGYFDTEEAAALAYNNAASSLMPGFAFLNNLDECQALQAIQPDEGVYYA